MSIMRKERPDNNFYILDKSISEDKNLSWAARGLLVYLLGKPDNWVVSVSALINETAECDFPVGRDGVRRIIKELEKHGYLSKESKRADDGKMAGVDYIVSEKSSPQTDKPSTDLPASAQTPQISIEVNQGLRKTSLSSYEDCMCVLQYMNDKAGKRFKPVNSNMRFIRARLAEGATVEEMKAVVDLKVADWRGTEMDWYLRPETLFNATKYQTYAANIGKSAKQAELEQHRRQFKGAV